MIEQGDKPFTILWSKDKEMIGVGPSQLGTHRGDQRLGLRITNIEEHSSMILIERVNASHTGNYTCMARNSVAEVSYTAELVVRGKKKK